MPHKSSHEQNSGRIFRIYSKGEHLETIFVKIIARLPPQVQELPLEQKIEGRIVLG